MTEKLGDLDVSRETYQRLLTFADLVQKWTPKINLIAPSTLDDLWQRHIVDSAQIHAFAPSHYARWVDIGSGGGFPGIVIAILAAERAPDAQITLIESDQRKATFLRTVCRELALPTKVICARIEQARPQQADVISARALSGLPKLLSMVDRHLAPNGMALLHKGRQHEQEIADARKTWSFDLEEHQSLTDPAARILAIQGLKRVA